MSFFSRLYRGDIHWDFVGNRRRWFTLSAALILTSVLALSIRGLNLSVDFVGGTLVELPNPEGVSVGEVRGALTDIGFEGARVQTTGGGEGVRVQTEELDSDQQAVVVAAVAAVTGANPGDASAQSVGPTFGSQIAASALRALIVFLAVVAVFISIRLEWKMALVGLAALGHDVVLTAGVYALVGFEVTPATIIAVLTILGYSLYDTVVVFDKIVENVEERGERHTASAIVNMSMNQVFMRSVNTSLTSLLPIGSLLFVGSFLLGAATLREFALALFVGVTTGTYSSIFLAAPLLAVWKEREEHWQRVRRRMQRKGSEDEFAARILDVVPEAETEGLPVALTGAMPRPPKKRRRRR